jgi:hypothetical protein
LGETAEAEDVQRLSVLRLRRGPASAGAPAMGSAPATSCRGHVQRVHGEVLVAAPGWSHSERCRANNPRHAVTSTSGAPVNTAALHASYLVCQILTTWNQLTRLLCDDAGSPQRMCTRNQRSTRSWTSLAFAGSPCLSPAYITSSYSLPSAWSRWASRSASPAGTRSSAVP